MGKSWKAKLADFFNNLWAGAVLMAIAGVAGILYTRYGPTWTVPIVNGIISSALVMSIFVSIRAFLALPPASPRVTLDNAGEKVRDWLHKFQLTIKSTHQPGDAFGFIVKTDGGKTIVVKRHLTFNPDYIGVSGLITLTEEQKALAETLTEIEGFDAMSDIKMELCRAKMGFSAVDVINKGIFFYKQVPITPSLSEKEVIDAVWEVEAIIGLVMEVNARSEMRLTIARKEAQNEAGLSRGPGSLEEIRGRDEEAVSSYKASQPIQIAPAQTEV